MIFENIPQILKDYPHWCVWLKTKKGTKLPINPRTEKAGESNDKTTYTPYANAE